MKYTVIIPAGGTISDEYMRRIGAPHRALAPFGSRSTPVMQRVIDALRTSEYAETVIATAPELVQEQVHGVDHWIPSGSSGLDNVLAAIPFLENRCDPVVICASDLPLITSASINMFLDRTALDTEIVLGVVEKSAYLEAYPGSPMSTFADFADKVSVTLAGLFLVRPEVLVNNRLLLESAFARRKSLWSMARLLGAPLLCRFALGRLSLPAAQTRAEALLNCRSTILRGCPPELGFDMDSPEDYSYAAARIGGEAVLNAGG